MACVTHPVEALPTAPSGSAHTNQRRKLAQGADCERSSEFGTLKLVLQSERWV
jgi:hypothetical protein